MIRAYLALALIALTRFSACYKYEDERRLMAYLFNPSRYDKSVRPVQDSTTPTKVVVSQTVRAIINVDVSEGQMCSFSFLTFSWRDELLTWNTTDYGGITEVSLPSGKLWNPEFEKTFAGACKDIDYEASFQSIKVTLLYQGLVFIFVAKSIGAMCKVDLTNYPFDRHVCIHHFYTTKYSPDELAIHFKDSSYVFDVKIYKESQVWDVQNTEQRVINYTEQSSALLVSYAAIYITIKRRQGFIMINKFAPSCMISILTLFTPLVPPDSERLSFAITTYLAMVFLNISFVDEIPRNAVAIILLSKYLLALNIIATIGIIWSISIVCLSNTSASNWRVPVTLQKLVSKRLKKRKLNEEVPRSEPEHNVDESTEFKEIGWYDVTRYFDKIFFITSVLLVGATNGIIFQSIIQSNFKK